MKLDMQLAQLKRKLQAIQKKKDLCVAKQFELEDANKTHLAAYQKSIDLDFELASQIVEIERQIKNKKAQIKRRVSK